MYRSRSASARLPRRGIILLVVLALLTLLALVGLTFVLYADAEAASARLHREAQSRQQADVEPELLLAYFLGQLVYDVDDDVGLDSCLRGHSLARLAYGWNPDDPVGNVTPFNGTGRLHEPVSFLAGGRAEVVDGYRLVNYTGFRGADGSLADGFLRDPERLGRRTSLAQPPGPYTGGFNAPYTYPDLNNLFLAAVKADGTVLLPSFHRPWTGFGPLGPENPNWYDATKPWLKYQVLRPRPADMGPGFPALEDAGGDVKNLIGAPGGNDSVWLDLGFPVLTSPDGRRYKPLFAPLIVDLDNRVNVNVHGNVRGAGNAHRSNQGWGPWEVNLGRVLTRQDEWANLLLGTAAPPRPGRYGRDGKPASAGAQAPPGPRPHVYAQVDFDGSNEGPGGAATGRIRLPGAGAPPRSCFPSFPAGYGNGSGGAPGTERWEHPLLANPFQPAGDDRRFAPADLEALLRYGDTGSQALTSELSRLCPANFDDPRARRLVTTLSFDLDRPGVAPWLFDRDDSAYRSPLASPDRPPTGPAVPFPALTLRGSARVPVDGEFRTPGEPADNPSSDWRSALAALGRVDLNRFLPPYPHQGRGTDPAAYSQAPLVSYADRFDADGEAVWEQFRAAQAARQRLADDLYRRLLAVTGVAAPADRARPTDAELTPRRWLAQLAVNVVDFLDEDDISTPFNFYTARDGGPGFDAGAVSAGNPELPRYWVFGTELPRVVLNEVLTEYEPPPDPGPDPARPGAGRFDVRVWVELFNPLPAGPLPPGAQPQDARPVPLYVAPGGGKPGYGPYKVVLANTNRNPGGPLLPRPGNNDNVLGAPDMARAQTGDADFAGPVGTVGGSDPAAPPALAPQGFFLLGPPGTDARGTIAPPPASRPQPARQARSAAGPGATPWLKSPNLRYPVRFTPPDTWSPDYRRDGLTVLLRRLANPHLPPDPRPAVGSAPNPAYNPYVTIDYLEAVPLNDASDPAAGYASRGKLQPYAADPSQVVPQAPAPGPGTWHTLGRPNDPAPAGGHYDWLVHLDRQLISPIELLHVSGQPPHRLTHRFLGRDVLAGPPSRSVLAGPGLTLAGPGSGQARERPFDHRVPWFDETNRLYRVFEFLQTHDRVAGVSPGGRVPGKVNLNTVWDVETFRALCDPQPGNHFTLADVDAVFARLVALRTPAGAPGPDDRPFLGMAVGVSPKPGDAPYPPGGGALFPNGSGINDTFLRSADAGGDASTPRLLQVPGAAHPYQQFELLTKVFNHLTARSNVFAVWLTVGFFEVTDDTTRPVKLGAELGRAEGRHVRHRLFAVVDRTSLTVFSTTSNTPVSLPAGQGDVTATVRPARVDGTGANGRPWRIQAGSVLVIEPGSVREETVTVTAATPTSFTATFTRSHPAGFPIACRGNPGPWPRFDPRDDPEIVPYFSVID
jgi:hypothetical protein